MQNLVIKIFFKEFYFIFLEKEVLQWTALLEVNEKIVFFYK